MEADTATIILSVITKGKDVAETSAENANKMTAVQDAIKAKAAAMDAAIEEAINCLFNI